MRSNALTRSINQSEERITHIGQVIAPGLYCGASGGISSHHKVSSRKRDIVSTGAQKRELAGRRVPLSASSSIERGASNRKGRIGAGAAEHCIYQYQALGAWYSVISGRARKRRRRAAGEAISASVRNLGRNGFNVAAKIVKRMAGGMKDEWRWRT
jgi:hypothetical protein